MSKETHTPGPWFINQFKGETYRVSPHQFGCARPDRVAEMIKSEADARLIAAAPELLEALIEYVDEFEGDFTPSNPRYQKARAAIAKARGQEQVSSR